MWAGRCGWKASEQGSRCCMGAVHCDDEVPGLTKRGACGEEWKGKRDVCRCTEAGSENRNLCNVIHHCHRNNLTNFYKKNLKRSKKDQPTSVECTWSLFFFSNFDCVHISLQKKRSSLVLSVVEEKNS